jgi:hypothetical protein
LEVRKLLVGALEVKSNLIGKGAAKGVARVSATTLCEQNP